MKYDFDFMVIGAGSGGVRASRMAAKHGARVAVIEAGDLGGTCVNVGCIPKKLFAYSAQFHETKRDAQGYGWQMDNLQFHWQTLLDNKNKEIKRLNQIYEKLLIDAGVTLIQGFGELIDEHTLQVDEKKYIADKILIATGSHAFAPQFIGQEFAITSDQAFYLPQLPKKAIIMGGGYIAVEFATIFNGLGVETTLMYRGDLLLREFDEDIRVVVGEELKKKGIRLLPHHQIQMINKLDAHFEVHSQEKPMTTDLILLATGRKPNLQAIQKLKLMLTENSGIQVNDHYQTSIPNIYAVGDVIGGPQLTPLAIAQGHVVADNLFAHKNRRLNSTLIPTAVFCEPNIGTVGLTEQQAKEQFDIQIYKASFRALKHTLTGSDEKNFMKLIVDKKTDKVLGAHMVGENAGEIIQGIAIAIQNGATKTDFDNTLAIHPTSAEEFVLMR